MYQRSYGETQFPEGFDDGPGLCAHLGQPRAAERAAGGRGVSRHRPRASRDRRCVAGTLEDYARGGLAARGSELPVVTEELGDSWIHGTASDPVKLARFRALQRLYDGFEAEGLDAPAPGVRAGADAGGGAYLGRGYQELPAGRPGLGPARLRGGARVGPRLHSRRHPGPSSGAYLDAAVADGSAEADRRARAEVDAGGACGGERAGTGGGWSIELAPDNGDIRALVPPAGREITGLDRRS